MRLTKPADIAVIAKRARGVHAWRGLGHLVLALGFASGASAETYTVGLGGGCSHATIATALTTAENHPGPDTIRLTRSISYNQQAINFGLTNSAIPRTTRATTTCDSESWEKTAVGRYRKRSTR